MPDSLDSLSESPNQDLVAKSPQATAPHNFDSMQLPDNTTSPNLVQSSALQVR
jgi:hypothetical protein